MATDRQNSATNIKAEGVAGEAALFVTFYGPREEAPPLYERLESLVEQHPANKLTPRRYDPPAAHDATVIRFAINAPREEDAATAWQTTRRELEAILNAPDMSTGWWGYTLIYQAVLNPGVDLTSVPKELLSTVRRPNASEGLETLAQANMAGGRLWLMGIPQGDGLTAATVYVALSPSDEEKAFKQALLEQIQLMLDLIAHKGYYLKRQYRGDPQRGYEIGLGTFRRATDELLGDLGEQTEEYGGLNRLASTYKGYISELGRLRKSVAQQLPNYREWQQQIGNNSITEYHYRHLEMAHQELELMIAQGRDALEEAYTAISMAQVRAQEEQARRQQFTQTILAVVGAALAVPQLIDRDAAGALIGLIVPESWSGELLVQLGAQFGFILFFAFLAMLAVWWINNRRRRRDDSEE